MVRVIGTNGILGVRALAFGSGPDGWPVWRDEEPPKEKPEFVPVFISDPAEFVELGKPKKTKRKL